MSPRPFSAALLALLFAFSAHAAPVRTDHIEAELIAEHTALAPGENWVALRLKPDSGWHTYWQNPGDSGIPTSLTWTLPAGVSACAIQWPYPQAFALGGLTIYGYGEQTLHLIPVSLPKNWPAGTPLNLHAEAKWLVCADVCIPGKADLDLTLPISAAPQPDPRWTQAFAEARARLPGAMPAGWKVLFGTDKRDLSFSISGGSFTSASGIAFFPYASDLINHAAPLRTSLDGGVLKMSQALNAYFISAPAELRGVLEVLDHGSTRAYDISGQAGAVTPVAANASANASTEPASAAGDHGLLMVLLFALLGGVLLNLMPCVFPVLSLKALSVMQGRSHDTARQRAHALAYTAGVVLSCAAVAAVLLALRAGGEAIGWGFQLQSPVFVAVLVYLLFALGLALSGAVEIGSSVMGLGQSLTQ
ncbi:MAG: protein-disulfide reductase DsbD domain-containing protein, partial [Stenotrophobium sp.]